MGRLVQPSCRSRVTYSRLHSTTSRRVLNISREGDSTTSLGSLGQGSVTLRVKKFFLMFRRKISIKISSWAPGGTKPLAGWPANTAAAEPGWPPTRSGSTSTVPTEMLLPKTGKSCWRSPCRGPGAARSWPQELLSAQWSGAGLAVWVSFLFARFPYSSTGWLLAEGSSSSEGSSGAGHFLQIGSFAVAVDPSSNGFSFTGERHLKSPA